MCHWVQRAFQKCMTSLHAASLANSYNDHGHCFNVISGTRGCYCDVIQSSRPLSSSPPGPWKSSRRSRIRTLSSQGTTPVPPRGTSPSPSLWWKSRCRCRHNKVSGFSSRSQRALALTVTILQLSILSMQYWLFNSSCTSVCEL